MELRKPINVTRSFMPPLGDVVSLLEGVWERAYLTNNGPLLLDLEKRLAQKNNVDRIVSVLNGTVAIELALEACGVHGGEVITTPFTFPATSTAIVRTGNIPVFVDIDPKIWNIDPEEVEKAVTPKTKAILPVHVFSCPCEVERLRGIADRHNLKLIYDGAHANFVKRGGRSIFEYGDCSTVSFHATKLYHTVEGGACFSSNDLIFERLRQLRFFGYDSQKRLSLVGTNAKMTEISAAVGLANLKYLDQVLAERKSLYEHYLEHLAECDGLEFQTFNPSEYNYSYFPVLFKNEEQLLRVNSALNVKQIFPRRYFWPLLSDMPAFKDVKVAGDLNVARNVSSRILCLPLYPGLSKETVDEICSIAKESLVK